MDFLKNKKILVTGGAGFIGSHLCEYLINSDAIVTCLDNFLTGKKNNLVNIINHPRFNLIEGDIRNIETCRLASKNQDYILHQAALGSVPRSVKDPNTTNEININGFLNMLISAKENNVKRFVYASSSSVYGDSEILPKIEEKIGIPLSPYAITKYVNELYADNFSKLFGLQTIGLRYFNVFGPKQDPNGPYAAVIPKFIDSLLNYESPVINGDGSYSRDFTYVKNIILMNVLSMKTKKINAINQVYNAAFGDKINLIELFKIIKSNIINFDTKVKTIDVRFGEFRKGDIPHSQASIEKSNKLLNYIPTHNFNQGIHETIDWYFLNKKNFSD